MWLTSIAVALHVWGPGFTPNINNNNNKIPWYASVACKNDIILTTEKKLHNIHFVENITKLHVNYKKEKINLLGNQTHLYMLYKITIKYMSQAW